MTIQLSMNLRRATLISPPCCDDHLNSPCEGGGEDGVVRVQHCFRALSGVFLGSVSETPIRYVVFLREPGISLLTRARFRMLVEGSLRGFTP